MHAVLTVLQKEFRENLRDRRTLISALLLGPLLMPALFAGLLALMLERNAPDVERPVTLAVAHAERAPNLLAFLREHGVTVDAVDFDDAAARRAVSADSRRLVLLIDSGFADRLAATKPAPLYFYADTSNAESQRNAARAKALIGQYSLMIARLRIQARGIDPWVLNPIVAQDIDVSTPASRSVLVLGTLSFIVLMTMLLGGLYLAIDATAGERERGSLEPLLTVPVRREQLIYGKILAACAFMTLSLVLTVSAFAILFRFIGLERFGMSVNFGPTAAVSIMLCCLPLVPLGAALMTIVGALTRSYREAQTYVGIVLLVPTLPLVTASALGLRPSVWLMMVPSLSQHFLITSVLRDEALSGAYIGLSAGVTLAAGVALTLLAGRLYYREALLG